MRPRYGLLLVILVLAPTVVPATTAHHAPTPPLQELMDAWVAGANATLSEAPVPNIDEGVRTTLLQDLTSKSHQRRPLELALSTARVLYFADYANLSVDAPPYDHQANQTTKRAQGEAHRLYFLNETDELYAAALTDVAAAKAAYAAFTPRTGAGAEMAVVGASILVVAQEVLEAQYNGSRQKVAVEYIYPDVTTGVYRSAVQTLVFHTVGMSHLSRLSLDVLDVAEAVDATGDTLLRPTPWHKVLDEREARAASPSYTAPGTEQPRLARLSATAFADDAPLVGLAAYVKYEAARRNGADQFRLSHGTIDRSDLVERLNDGFATAELALNETAVNGLSGALLQDAVADAVAIGGPGMDTATLGRTVTKLEATLAMHQAFVTAVGAEEGDDALPPLAIVGAGLLLAAVAGFFLVRARKGGGA